MPRKLSILSTAVFIAWLSAVSAFAQAVRPAPARSVLSDYHKGEAAIKAKNWDEAIGALTSAVNADPKDGQYRDGVITDKYFPHHYLFIAYSEKGDAAKARENWNLRGNLPADFFQQEQPYVAKLNGPPGGGGPGPVPTGPAPVVLTPSGAAPGGTGAVDKALAPYNAGVVAIKAGRWQDAITAFNNAIKVDAEDKPRADVPDGYFPHYYLAIANLRLNKLDEASANFEKRGTIAKTIPLADEEARFTKEVDFARFAAAGDDAASKQQVQAAVDNWNKACAALQSDCDSRGLRQKITDASNSLQRAAAANQVRTQVASAKSHVAEGDFDAAKKEYAAASAADPNNADAAAGLKDIQSREDNYNAAKTRGDQAQKANKLDDAEREYEAARTAHAQWFRRDKLDAVVANVNTQLMKTQGIAAVAASAQKAFDAGNFASAKQSAEAVLAQDPNNAPMKSIVTRSESRILYEDGRKMAAAGDYFQADSKYKEAAQKDPAYEAANKALGQSAQYFGFVSQKLYTQAKNADPARFAKERPDQNFDILDLIKQANVAFDNQDFGSAAKRVDEALKRDPENKNAIGLRHRIESVRTAAREADPVAPVTDKTTLAPNGAPLMPMWVWGAIAAVTFVGAGSLFMVRGRTPMPVAVDALPWGKVSIQQKGKPAKAAPTEKTTPFLVNLPPGEYELQVTSESMSQPYTTKVVVQRGQPNKFVVTMPAYDVDEILSTLLG